LAGLVRRRLVATLPGDGFLVTYDERADRIERTRFEASWAADLVPSATPGAALALATGRLPESAAAGARPEVPPEGPPEFPAGPAAAGILRVLSKAGVLRRLEWWDGTEHRLTLEYDRWVRVGTTRVPQRLRVAAPSAAFRAEVELERIEPRDSFAARDFDVD